MKRSTHFIMYIIVIAFVQVPASAQEHFDPVEPTGQPFAVIVDSAFHGEAMLVAGDEIGIFAPYEFEYICVGAAIVDGNYPIPMTAWEADERNGFPGFDRWEDLNFHIWIADEEIEYHCEVDRELDPWGPYMMVNLHTTTYLGHFTLDRWGGQPFAMVVNNASFDFEPLGEGDEIGVFVYTIENELACIGAEVTNGDYPFAMTIWLGNPELINLNTVFFRTWIDEIEEEFECVSEWEDEWGWDGPFREVSIYSYSELEDQLTLNGNRWNLLSFPYDPLTPELEFLAPLIDHFVILQHDEGGIYIDEEINTINAIDISEGYRIFVEEESSLEYSGRVINPALEIEIEGNRINWIPFPFAYGLPTEQALEAIADDIEILLNDAGEFWIPGLINTMPFMLPGEGYMVFSHTDLNFHYNFNAEQNGTSIAQPTVQTDFALDAPEPTGLPYVILVKNDSDLIAAGAATIEALDGNQGVGKSLILEDDHYTPIVTWQGDPVHELTGYTSGNRIELIVRDGEGKPLNNQLEVSGSGKFGDLPYAEFTINTLSSHSIPVEFTVSPTFPNPFNPSVSIDISLPAAAKVSFIVTDILGRELYRTQQHKNAGLHRFSFDSNALELSSGLY
ncbi:T9SS type A sorting domain-containing protein [bacterium]|nr:T9SS type A sorting domain-containing protein [bacterium]